MSIFANLPFLSALPPDYLPFAVGLIVAVCLGVVWLIWRWPSSGNSTPVAGSFDSAEISATPQAVFSPAEAARFNMVRLVVQDLFLVFAQLPLAAVFSFQHDDTEARKRIAKTAQLIRIDIALVHPGTLQLAKVILFSPNAQSSPTTHNQKTQALTALLTAHEIDTIHLDPDTAYTVPQLTELLGLAEEE